MRIRGSLMVFTVLFLVLAAPLRQQEYTVPDARTGTSTLDVRTESLSSIVLGQSVSVTSAALAAGLALSFAACAWVLFAPSRKR